MMFLLRLFGGLSVPERLRKPLAYIGGALLAAAILGALWLWLSARENADDRHNQGIGAAAQREADLKQTITNVEKANAAAKTQRNDAGAARDECLRNARNPADC